MVESEKELNSILIRVTQRQEFRTQSSLPFQVSELQFPVCTVGSVT